MSDFADLRGRMVRRQIEARGILDPLILDAFREVPREKFVAGEFAAAAYDDHPLPIEAGQTISQPYIVALMIEAARHLTWRAARPVIGEGDRRVLQDFELTVELPEDGPWRDTAARVDAAIAEAAQRISPNPLPPGFRINDLILRRYAAGSRGITAHRDHIRYRGLVALLILSGDGRFCLCEDRSGASAREIAARPPAGVRWTKLAVNKLILDQLNLTLDFGLAAEMLAARGARSLSEMGPRSKRS